MERIIYDKMKACGLDHVIMNLHLQAYSFAHQFVHGKTVLDAACGTGFGSMIYSTGAKSIIAVDKDEKAISRGRELPSFCPITFEVKDLDKDILPEADVCVSVETIEHLNGGGFFLKNLRVKQLVFTIPLGPLDQENSFHKLEFMTPDAAIAFFTDCGWPIITGVARESRIAANFENGPGIFVYNMMLGMAERGK